jgi:arylformamidase
MTIFDSWDQEELNRQYSPSSLVPDFKAILDRCRIGSERAREKLECETDIPYGAESAERLDFFPPLSRAHRDGPPPVHAFVHGGQWQEVTKEESAFAAPQVVNSGAGFIAIGYGLAPRFSLGEIAAQVRRALNWIRAHASDLGVAKDRVHASGSSAGAHLVAMSLCHQEAPRLSGVCLLSGVYDLEPVRLSYVNRLLRLDRAEARRYSPLFHLPDSFPETVIACGSNETSEYHRQHSVMAQALNGRAVVTPLIAKGRHHFNLPEDIARPGTLLGQAVLRQMRLN